VNADFCLGGGVITDCGGSAQRQPASRRIAIDVNADLCLGGGALIIPDCCLLSLISFRRRRDRDGCALTVLSADIFSIL